LFILCRQNLDLYKELNDKVAEGRTLGNIGNVNYLLQDYSTSIEYLDKVWNNFYVDNHFVFIQIAFDNCQRM
jgi:hypothetical protein